MADYLTIRPFRRSGLVVSFVHADIKSYLITQEKAKCMVLIDKLEPRVRLGDNDKKTSC